MATAAELGAAVQQKHTEHAERERIELASGAFPAVLQLFCCCLAGHTGASKVYANEVEFTSTACFEQVPGAGSKANIPSSCWVLDMRSLRSLCRELS